MTAIIGISAHALPVIANAQTYPSKPIRIVIPFPASGGTDVIARTVQPKMTEALGQTLILDNRSGANGNVGTEIVARSAPDGYTLLLNGSGTLAINPGLYAKLPYDSIKDFAPVSIMVLQPSVLVVHPSLPARNVKELIVLAKSKPGQLNFASSGSGSISHLAAEVFSMMGGIQMVHVPYKGAGPAMVDLVAGQVQVNFGGSPSVMPHVKSGRLRALGVTTAKRVTATPELPTIAEAGLPGYEATGWYGLLAPAGTPDAIISRLNQVMIATLQNADIRDKLVGLGLEVSTSTPQQFTDFMKSEIAKYTKVIKAANVKVD